MSKGFDNEKYLDERLSAELNYRSYLMENPDYDPGDEEEEEIVEDSESTDEMRLSEPLSDLTTTNDMFEQKMKNIQDRVANFESILRHFRLQILEQRENSGDLLKRMITINEEISEMIQMDSAIDSKSIPDCYDTEEEFAKRSK